MINLKQARKVTLAVRPQSEHTRIVPGKSMRLCAAQASLAVLVPQHSAKPRAVCASLFLAIANDEGELMLKFLTGIGAGVGLGLMIAPAAGRETRRQLMDIAKDPTGAVRDQVQQVRQKAGDIGANLGRQAAQQAVDKVIPDKLNERGA